MASKGFSHRENLSPEPGSKLGESGRHACLEAQDATRSELSISPKQETTLKGLPLKCRFKNGWFCKTCDRVTEHKAVKRQQVCLECGAKMGQSYHQRPDVKAKQRAKLRKQSIEKLEAKLRALKREALLCKV